MGSSVAKNKIYTHGYITASYKDFSGCLKDFISNLLVNINALPSEWVEGVKDALRDRGKAEYVELIEEYQQLAVSPENDDLLLEAVGG